jgi:hypothetical protein
MTLKVIKPITFADSMLISTTAAEAHPAWAAGTSYAKGAKVDYLTHIYESLVNSNVGNNPAASPTSWLNIGPDNVHAMFDDSVTTATTGTGSLSVTLAPGMVNSLALINLTGATVTITVTDGAGGPVVFTRTFDLDGTIITDWYQYFFEPSVQKSELTVTDLPPYASARVTITITGSGAVGVGNLVLGTFYELGEVLMGTTLGTDDYSLVTTDEFGDTTLTRRNSAKRSDMQVLVSRAQMRKVFQVLDGLRATPAVWIPSQRDDDSPLSIFGIRSSFRVVVDYAAHVLVSLELKGMT